LIENLIGFHQFLMIDSASEILIEYGLKTEVTRAVI